MKTAIPYWQDRISPVLDTAENFLVFSVVGGRTLESGRVNLGRSSFADRIAHLRELGCSVLLCGAVSDHYHQVVMANGIEVIPWLRGRVDEIIAAYADGSLSHVGFTMPGCRCRRRQRRGQGNRQGRRRHEKW